jgi:hypothetical protein
MDTTQSQPKPYHNRGKVVWLSKSLKHKRDCNLVNKANLVHNFSLYISFLYVFRATVCLQTRQSSTKNNKYQVSHKYSCFSWWWAHSRPKHVEKRNEQRKILHKFVFIYKIIQRSTKRKIQDCNVIQKPSSFVTVDTRAWHCRYNGNRCFDVTHKPSLL